MSDVVVRMEHVYKMFRKGEVFNSLRDLLPALTGKMFRQSELDEDDEREFWALQDISFEVRAGECFGIIGHNGAGKSTALKILSRIMKPTKGRMIVNGRLSAVIEVSAGFHQDLTGRENIFLNGAILGMTKREIQSKLDQIIEFSGIEEFIDTPVKRYSSGMYARLGFSVAAHVDPDVLIVDEVLSVGDWAFQLKCIERMKEVLRNGVAVLYVSHNMKTVVDFCHRCLLLEKGKIDMIGPTDDVVSKYVQTLDRVVAPLLTREVEITGVTLRSDRGEKTQFKPGEKVWVDIEITARTACRKLAVCLYILDDKSVVIFDISTDLLGLDGIDLNEGDSYSCTYELDLNLVDGTFYPSVLIYRRDIATVYDKWEPVKTIYVASDGAVRGVVQCFPRVIRQETRKALSLNPAIVGFRNSE
jgi:lipopolysaccharide transport system ATP-binding protein